MDDLAQAKLLWRSEEVVPLCKAYAAASGGYEGGRHGKSQKDLPSGGGASPVVAGGKVFLTYFVPSGEAHAEKLPPRMSLEPKSQRVIEADVVFLAIDAATGRTAWKRVFPREGVNMQTMKSCSYSGLSPCVGDGLIFGLSTSLRLHALRIDTGEPVWEIPVPGHAEVIAETRREALAEKRLADAGPLDKRVGGSLVYVAGVVIVPPAGEWLAFEGSTGRPLWSHKGISGTAATPACWMSGRNSYLIAAGERPPVLRCIEPRTGRIVWEQAGFGPNHGTVIVGGDILIAKARPLTKPDPKNPSAVESLPQGELAAFRLTASGPQKIWSLPLAQYVWDEQTPVVWQGHVYAQLSRPEQKTRRLVCIELATGKVVGEVATPPGGGGDACTAVVDGRVIASGDASHVRNAYGLYRADPANLEQLGSLWTPPNPPTTAYHPALSFPIVAGRLFLRGADGIYCYDLRVSTENP